MRKSELALVIIGTLFFIVENSFSITNDSLSDVFPLSINNSWQYSSYHSDEYCQGIGGPCSGSIETDTVSYKIEDSIRYTDSIIWYVKKKVKGYHQYYGNVSDTSHYVNDSIIFPLYEKLTGNHQLYITYGNGLYSWYLPFRYCDSNHIYRFQNVSSQDSTMRILFCGSDYRSFNSIYKKNIGIIWMRYEAHSTLFNESFKVDLLNYDVVLGVNEISRRAENLQGIMLENYPNPFNSMTTIRFTLNSFNSVSLKIFDVVGRELATLIDETRPKGLYEINFDASQYSSGLYFYKLQVGNFSKVKKMVIIK
ncbi:MAG: T9SS type A sorting domain-containing protein [Ignavibacteria bacterium]|nr:T9SS type A sorting domain-containing protein [Ignavibacteria bacterium]